MLEKSLYELDLNTRIHNSFKNEGFKTIGDVLKYDEQELLQIPNFGRKSLNEFNDIIRPYGLRIAGTRTKRFIGVSVPHDVFEYIKARALANERSLEAEVVAMLSDATGKGGAAPTMAERLDKLEAIVSAHFPVG